MTHGEFPKGADLFEVIIPFAGCGGLIEVNQRVKEVASPLTQFENFGEFVNALEREVALSLDNQADIIGRGESCFLGEGPIGIAPLHTLVFGFIEVFKQAAVIVIAK